MKSKTEPSTAFYEDILAGMKDYVRVIDFNGKVVYQNQRMKQELGSQLGEECYALLQKKKRCENCICKSLQSIGMTGERKVEIGSRVFSVISAPVNDGLGSAVEVFRDITELTRMRDQLMEQNRQMKRDLEFAKDLQKRLLPETGKCGDLVKVHSAYQAAEMLGGDLFDVLELDEDRVGFYIADVSGHGVTSSLITMFVNRTLGSLKEQAADPCTALDALFKQYEQLELFERKYITILYGVYDRQKGTIRFSNGGHNCPPLLIRQGQVSEIPVAGLPIGVLYGTLRCDIEEIHVQSGDRLLLYTDGIVEGRNADKDFYGARFTQLVSAGGHMESQAIIQHAMHDVNRFTDGRIEDDMAMMVIEIL